MVNAYIHNNEVHFSFDKKLDIYDKDKCKLMVELSNQHIIDMRESGKSNDDILHYSYLHTAMVQEIIELHGQEFYNKIMNT